MFELKKLSPDGVEVALQKAERYRLLNEPWEAESICRDVLGVDPDNPRARVLLVLALTDQLRSANPPRVAEVQALADDLPEPYERAYYNGIICERIGKARLARGGPGTGPVVYDWLRQAMDWYLEAEARHPPGDDSALLRWNTCARLIDRYRHIAPAAEQPEAMLE
ncbi:MAG TPA: hypothetical protein VMM12_01675 [Longimicrobiales bacterium]|nr:hypothetical protein [Longimicrobiales bacterium]